MNPKFVGLSIFAIIVSFIAGFAFANSLNRNELSRSRSVGPNDVPAANASTQNPGDITLTSAEIASRIAEADQNPSNISFQRALGIALYKYAGSQQDASLLTEVSRLLLRVYENDPKDYEVLVSLGNCYFDTGLLQKNDEIFKKSKKYYLEALEIKPNDLDVRVDIGLIFALSTPPESEKAIAEFEKALKVDPNHEKSLQSIAHAYLTTQQFSEAEKFITRLQKINPQNPRLPDLQNQLANKALVLSK